MKNEKYVKLSIVHCPPVTMAIIKRPHPTFQLGFSVEDGIVSTFARFIYFFSIRLQSGLTLNDQKRSLSLKLHLLGYQMSPLWKVTSCVPTADLQSDAWGHRRKRRHSCWTPNHWNQRTECCRYTARQDHPDLNQRCRRGEQERLNGVSRLLNAVEEIITHHFLFVCRFIWRRCQLQHIDCWLDRNSQYFFEHCLLNYAQCCTVYLMNFCQKSENIMHELVPRRQMLQDSLHSFIFSILMQKHFSQVTDPFYLSVSKPNLINKLFS